MSDANGCSVNPKVITVNVKPQLQAAGTTVTICDTKPINLKSNNYNAG